MVGSETPETLRWRKSSYSAETNCVEVAALPDGRIAMRSSDDPTGAVVIFTREEIDAFFKGVKASQFDDLV